MKVHLNSRVVDRSEAMVSPFDRGFLFGDGIYEGLRAFDGVVIGAEAHVDRMQEGLNECRIPWDASPIPALTAELLAANDLRDAFIYWQVTRGTPLPGRAVRSRVADGPVHPTVFGYCVPLPGIDGCREVATVRARTVEDLRWLRGHVKSISLLGNVLGAVDAAEAGVDDAVFVRDGLVGEATSTNIVLAVPDGAGGVELVTPSIRSAPILAGVTRKILLDLGLIHDRAVRVEELRAAREVMLLGTISMIKSVVELDGRPVGAGVPGPLARGLLARYLEFIRESIAGAIGVRA